MIQNNRILIVEDDPGVSETYRKILAGSSKPDILSKGIALYEKTAQEKTLITWRSHELTLAERGEDGIRQVAKAVEQQSPFAAAFIDMKMPGIDGAETAKRIWALDPDIKIVIVTAYSEYTPDDIIRVTGRDDIFYLRKPFNPEEIKQFARALTNQWRLEREKELLSVKLKKTCEKLEDLNKNLQTKVVEQTTQLIQSEKVAAMGILVAGVAHKINNPISFVSGNLSTMKKYCGRISSLLQMYKEMETSFGQGTITELPAFFDEIRNFKEKQKIDFILEDMLNLADESREGANRIRDIVNDLRIFSRIDKAEFKHINLHDAIEAAIKIIRNEIKPKVEIVKDYGELPQVKCFSRRMSQVFMNILMNAVQAIEEEGMIKIVTRYLEKGRRAEDKIVEIVISDTGRGISAKDITKIFDPFFTTKPPGHGTGLGLSIAHDIVKAHGGEIMVKSEKGVGTTFIVKLPVELKM